MNYVSYDDMLKIVNGIEKKVPQGILQGNTPVGTITWQYYEMDDYLTLDGSVVNNASIQYPELLAFVQTHSLITTDTSKTYLFQYDSTNDVMTLPDLRDMTVWGGSSVDKKEAGLPNIKGKFILRNSNQGSLIEEPSGVFTTTSSSYVTINVMQTATAGSRRVDFDASRSSSIYSNSVTTVQPPAIQLIPQIKYRTSTSVFNTINAGRFVATAPAHYEREQLFTTNKTIITIYPTWINIDGIGFVLQNNKTIDINNASNWDTASYATASNRAGKDFYIYAVYTSSNNVEPKFILSANSTIPTGYTANNSRKIGGFHCLCADVGTISGHTLTGYLAGEILPNSPWDLKHRAVSENEGMVYVDGIGKWVDIYLASWDGSKLVSICGGTIADGTSSPNWHGEKFAEYMGKIGKSLLLRDEFIVAAKGSNENTNILGSSDPGTTGGHKDTANRRMISNYGLEDCCGALWQWARGVTEFYPGASWSPTTNQYLSGYSWQTSSVYHSGTDPQSYGSCIGLLRRLLLGGSWDGNSNCGSRCAYCTAFSTYGGNANLAARGASEPRIA